MAISICAACGRGVYGPRFKVSDEDGEGMWVGPDCFRRIKEAGGEGYASSEGPILYAVPPESDED